MKINVQHLFKVVLANTQWNITLHLMRKTLILIIKCEANGCSPTLYHRRSVKHRELAALSPLYLLSHSHSSWGNDDVSTANAFIQSTEKVIWAVEHKAARVGAGNQSRAFKIRHEAILVSNDSQIDGGVAMLLNSCQQGGAITVPDLPRMKVIFWVQQLKL